MDSIADQMMPQASWSSKVAIKNALWFAGKVILALLARPGTTELFLKAGHPLNSTVANYGVPIAIGTLLHWVHDWAGTKTESPLV